MGKGKTLTVIVVTSLFIVSTGFAQTLDENWNDFLHYTKIGRFDLAKGYAQAILTSNPDPAKLMELSKKSPAGYKIMLMVIDSEPDAELVTLSKRIIEVIERGRYSHRSQPSVISEEIRRLSSTERGRLMAVQRLRNTGEYAIPYMLDAMADPTRKEEFAYIVWALPHVGRDAIRPLTTALQTNNIAIKAEIIKALGKIAYQQALGFLKYIAENDESQQLRLLASESIRQLDPSALKVPAAQLFYTLGEQYYYHTESLAPAEQADFANIWFWDPLQQKLVREEVDRSYFNELMAMRCCEWSLRANPTFGQAIGLWIAAFFKAESAGVEMPEYFDPDHADALVYATTAGPAYLQYALARAVRDNDAYVAYGLVEALAVTAGEKTLLYQVGATQPLIQALSFDSRAVRYSSAIAIAESGPRQSFAGSQYVIRNLAEALISGYQSTQGDINIWNQELADSYALRSAKAMLKLAESRNPVIDLSSASNVLIKAIDDTRPEIQIHVGQILSYLDSPNAQRAIAVMALSSQNDLDVRIEAFKSLANSSKMHSNMLMERMLDGIYEIISSKDSDPELRSAAAAAYGALNLPSQMVKDLILDQASD